MIISYLIGGIIIVLAMDIIGHFSKDDVRMTTGHMILVALVWPLVVIDFVLTLFGKPAPIANWITKKAQKYQK